MSIDRSEIMDDNIIMARRKKNADVRKAMCERFVAAMSDLGMNASEVSRKLGYANATTIRKVQRGDAFVDVERLYLFSKLTSPEGKCVDLHWLITGHKLVDDSGES